MVAKAGDLTIAFVVKGLALVNLHVNDRLGVNAEFILLIELVLQCNGSVVGTEDFRAQVLHEALQVIVQTACVDLFEK
jgi:hypothetical protein